MCTHALLAMFNKNTIDIVYQSPKWGEESRKSIDLHGNVGLYPLSLFILLSLKNILQLYAVAREMHLLAHRFKVTPRVAALLLARGAGLDRARRLVHLGSVSKK